MHRRVVGRLGGHHVAKASSHEAMLDLGEVALEIGPCVPQVGGDHADGKEGRRERGIERADEERHHVASRHLLLKKV
eukprot:524415-Prymnesium_polylepis.1